MAGRERTGERWPSSSDRHRRDAATAPHGSAIGAAEAAPRGPAIGAALAAAMPHAASLPAELLTFGAALAQRPDARARRINADLERLSRDVLRSGDPACAPFALRLLLEAARFHQVVGEADLALRALDVARAAAAIAEDDALEGRVLLATATAYLTGDDTRNACLYLERLNIHAARRPHAGLKLAAMGTAVIVLERMGLLDDARALALKLLDYPVQSKEGQLAHVLNAINGVRISHLVEHADAASLFVELLSEWATAPSAALPVDVWARAVIARCAHLIAQGKPARAQEQLAVAMSVCGDATSGFDATRARVLLQSAHAAATVATSDGEGIEWARESIAALLLQVDDMPRERTELLHAAITLGIASRADGARADAIGHLDHLRRSDDLREAGSMSLLRSPMTFERAVGLAADDADAAPEAADALWLYEGVDGMCVSFDRDGISLFTERDAELDRFFASSLKPSEVELEAPLRTSQYQVAENWAVAVELSAGGNGRQCFKVGRIAAALSLALGFSAERSVVVELACRLRHIGRASIGVLPPSPNQPRNWDDASLMREQAIAGQRILSFAADPTLAIAGRVARQRHRWWNGCGPTVGAGGEGIAVEARICAVADAFVSLVDPVGGGRRWSVERALGQVQTMAGVQLDPDLVALLTRALRFDETPTPAPAVPWVEAAVEASRLAEAHRRLKKTLEWTE